ASPPWNALSRASSEYASAGQRPTTSVETPAAAAAHANVSIAPPTPAAPNVDASSSSRILACPSDANHSRASHPTSSGAASAAPPSSREENNGVGPLTWSGAEI